MKHFIRTVFVAGFVAGFVLLTATPGHAASTGIVNAVTYQPLPASSSISVQILDNTDQNMAILKKFKSALKQNGYILSDNSHLIMTIELHDEMGDWTKNNRSHFVEFSTQQGTSSEDDTQIKFNLFDSNTGGLLNKGERPRSITVTPSQRQINITIEDASNGSRLWEGWASADKNYSTSNKALNHSMIPALISAIGKTVNNLSFNTP